MIAKWLCCWLIFAVSFLWVLNEGVTCRLSSFQLITMSCEAFCSEYSSVRERRPFSPDQIEISGTTYNTYIHIQTSVAYSTPHKCGARSGSPQISLSQTADTVLCSRCVGQVHTSHTNKGCQHTSSTWPLGWCAR